jgi:MFS family permease
MKKHGVILAEGMVYNLLFIGMQGFPLTALALYFNCSPVELSIIATLPIGAQFFQVFSGKICQLSKNRKKALIISAALARLPIILLPLGILFKIKSSLLLLTVAFFYSVFTALVSNIWTTAMGDIILKNERGIFFAKRFLLTSLTTIFSYYAYSRVLSNFDQSTGVLFLTGIMAFGGVASMMLFFFHDIPDRDESCTHIDLKIPFKDKKFRHYLVFIGFWTFAIEFSKPYFHYFSITNLGVPYSFLGKTTMVSGVVALIAFPVCGYLSKTIGNKKLLSGGIWISTYMLLLYFLMSEHNYKSLLVLDAIGTGIGWSAINLAVFNLLLEVSNEPRESFVASQAVVTGATGLLGAFLGGFVASFLKGRVVFIFGDAYFGLQVMFITGFFMRIYAILLLTRVKAFQKNIYYPGIRPLTFSIFGGKK